MLTNTTYPKATLLLEDGTLFHGRAFAGQGEAFGEVIFNTGMTGYQEILTDPSYKGQFVTMTYPLTGIYGVNEQDMESAGIHVEGFIVKEYQEYPSNWRSNCTLADFLNRHNVIGIEGIDTRALTRHIRIAGSMRAIISTKDMSKKDLMDRLDEKFSGLSGLDLVKVVSCREPYIWEDKPVAATTWKNPDYPYKIVALDYGIKFNILRNMKQRGFDVMVMPATSTAEEVLALKPDGIFLSNGPGDPEPLDYAVKMTQNILGKVPVFGICMGHEVLAMALGGTIFKLKFGHHGVNQPVKDMKTGKIEITSQNHGFCIDIRSSDALELTHINLNDGTLEGLNHKEVPAFSVQYHPEASPGPHDASYLFDRFKRLINEHK